MAVAIVIIVILVVAVAITVVLLANRRARGDRRAVARDARGATQARRRPTTSGAVDVDRARGDRTRARRRDARRRTAACSRRRGAATVVEYEPVDEEELGVTRRQFLNRGARSALVGFSARRLRRRVLGFLWPTGAGGFGGKVEAGKLADIIAVHRRRTGSRSTCPRRAPTSCSTRRTTLPDGEEGLQPVDLRGHGAGHRRALPALRAPRLPRAVVPDVAVVRVPVPRLEVQPRRREEGAARRPRGLDRFARRRRRRRRDDQHRRSSSIGPPIGTNTTGQQQEGPLCV